MRIAGIVITALLSTTLATGCVKKLSECKQSDKDYAGAKEMPPLKAPPGLQDPDTRNALRVPPLDTPERVRAQALHIHQQSVLAKAMPPGNLTGMTDEERSLVDRWYRSGANVK